MTLLNEHPTKLDSLISNFNWQQLKDDPTTEEIENWYAEVNSILWELDAGDSKEFKNKFEWIVNLWNAVRAGTMDSDLTYEITDIRRFLKEKLMGMKSEIEKRNSLDKEPSKLIEEKLDKIAELRNRSPKNNEFYVFQKECEDLLLDIFGEKASLQKLGGVSFDASDEERIQHYQKAIDKIEISLRSALSRVNSSIYKTNKNSTSHSPHFATNTTYNLNFDRNSGFVAVGNQATIKIKNYNQLELTKILQNISEVLSKEDIEEKDKTNSMLDIEALKAQVMKPEPNKPVVKTLWESVEKLSQFATIAALILQAKPYIESLVR